jgi:hypothetical protein
VLLEVQRPLLELLRGLAGSPTLLPSGDLLPPFDFHCPLMSLPLAFGTNLDNIPAAARYIETDKALVQRWRQRLGESRSPRVGLVWSGNPQNWIDQRRSIPLEDWLPHLSPGFEYVSLQNPVRDSDLAALERSGIRRFDAHWLDFPGTAALLDCLDVLLSVDTSVAHLGGAIGRPTYVLLPYEADWRWMRDREVSPWYPSMRLYRQTASGDWGGPMKRVGSDLSHLGRL